MTSQNDDIPKSHFINQHPPLTKFFPQPKSLPILLQSIMAIDFLVQHIGYTKVKFRSTRPRIGSNPNNTFQSRCLGEYNQVTVKKNPHISLIKKLPRYNYVTFYKFLKIIFAILRPSVPWINPIHPFKNSINQTISISFSL